MDRGEQQRPPNDAFERLMRDTWPTGYPAQPGTSRFWRVVNALACVGRVWGYGGAYHERMSQRPTGQPGNGAHRATRDD
jgi:hypothetical protein